MPYPPTKFGTFLDHRKQFIQIDDTKNYKRARVQLHWKGIVLRDEVEGALVKTKKQQIARRGELLVAEIDAKVGGVGIVPPELDRAIVSSHYFLFEINESKCLREWLDWFVRSGGLEDQFVARGSTNYAAIRPHHILNCEIPLPPLDEQHRILSRIQKMASTLENVTVLRKENATRQRSLLLSVYTKLIQGAKWFQMDEIAPLVRRRVTIDPLKDYFELGIRSFGNGTFHKPPALGASLGNKKVFQIEPGDLLFNIVFAWEGAVAVVRPEDEGRVGSHRFLSCVPKSDSALPAFLCFHFLTERGLDDLGLASPGGAGRNRTLGVEALARLAVPVPPMERQQWFASLLAKTEESVRLREKAGKELDALMPSILSKAFCGEL